MNRAGSNDFSISLHRKWTNGGGVSPKMHVRGGEASDLQPGVSFARRSGTLGKNCAATGYPYVLYLRWYMVQARTYTHTHTHTHTSHPHERGKNLERLQRDTRQPRRNVRVTVTDKLGNGYRSELIPSRFFSR